MICDKCKANVYDGLDICSNCGADLRTQRELERVQKEEEEKIKKKKLRKKIILISAAAVLAAALLTVIILMFPLKLEFSGQDKVATMTGTFDEIKVGVKANQPITYFAYALNPDDYTNEELYTEGDLEGGSFDLTMTINFLKVPQGESLLYIKAGTFFGGEGYYKITLTGSNDYTTAPDKEALVEVSEGKYLVSNELLVLFKDGTTDVDIQELISKYDGEVVGQLSIINEYQVKFSGSGESFINDIKSKLEGEPAVEKVHFNISNDTGINVVPNDSNFDDWDTSDPSGNNWGLECINAPEAWEYNDRMSPCKVGLIDSVLRYDHPDIGVPEDHVTIMPTQDFNDLPALTKYIDENCESAPYDGNLLEIMDHGSHCSGIIGAKADNGQGVCGVNWKADLYFNTWWYYSKEGSHDLDMTETDQGWMFAIARHVMAGCRVLSISVGSVFPSEPSIYEQDEVDMFETLITSLEDYGYDFLICKSAGNENDDASRYALNRIMTGGQHAKAHTIIVGAIENSKSIDNRYGEWETATNRIYNMADYSNYGDMVDIYAPGSHIYSTYFNGYDLMSGTSMSTPVVAGVCSLLYSLNPELKYRSVKTIVCGTPEDYCARNEKVYGIVNAKNAVDWIINDAKGTPPYVEPQFGFITGTIIDAKSRDTIGAVAIKAKNTATGEEFESCANDDGTYYFLLEPGRYDMEFAASDYVTETIYDIEIVDKVLNYNILLNLVGDEPAEGTASGYIVSAYDASEIPNAEIVIYKGINCIVGEPVTSVTADETGYYSVSLAPGNYTLYVSAEGYMSDSKAIMIISGDNTDSQNCALTPVLNDGEIRAVLTWGEYPLDVDAHLVGPTPDGSTFHIYFDNLNYVYNGSRYDNLDVDDMVSYGPETTSVYVGLDGKYTYYVHNYSDRQNTDNSNLANSGAQVRLFISGQSKPIVYNVPNEPGTLWKVFSYENGTVTPINEMSYETDFLSVGNEER